MHIWRGFAPCIDSLQLKPKTSWKDVVLIVNIKNKDFFLGVPQRSDIGSSYKRRKPEDSEITISDLENLLGNQLFDKICCLEDPYPNAFIKTKDGKKLLIKLAELE